MPSLDAMNPADMEGLVIGPVAHRVDRERIAAFVDVTGDDPRRWTKHAPPGYAAALLFAVAADFLTDERIAPYLATLIHVDQQFTYLEPIGVDTTVEITGTVQRVRERSGAYFVTFVAEGKTDDRVVLESRSTFLMSDQAATGTVEEEPEPAVDLRGENTTAGERRSVEIGKTAWLAKSASRADLVRYAAATADFNPLHWDHASAVAAGLPGVVVHGLLMVSWLAQLAASFTGDPAPIATIKVRFKSVLRPASPARLEATPIGIADDGRAANVKLRIGTGADDVVTGSATVRLMEVTP